MAFKKPSKRSYGARHGRKGRDQSGSFKTVLLIALLVLLPMLTLGGGGYLAYQHLNTETINTAYCYERHEQERVAVFVDFSLTQDISNSQRRDLKNTLIQAYEALPANGQIAVFTTANMITANVVEPFFDVCRPAKTALEQAEIGAPDSSAAKLARQHAEARSAYLRFVDELMDQSQSQTHQATRSPILAQIRGISRYDFGGPLDKVVIFSDGINNSETARFCTEAGHLPTFARFMERPDYAYIKPDDFQGADVHIQLVEGFKLPSDSMPFCTRQELRDFWVALFENNGAGAVQLTPLGYGAGQ